MAKKRSPKPNRRTLMIVAGLLIAAGLGYYYLHGSTATASGSTPGSNTDAGGASGGAAQAGAPDMGLVASVAAPGNVASAGYFGGGNVIYSSYTSSDAAPSPGGGPVVPAFQGGQPTYAGGSANSIGVPYGNPLFNSPTPPAIYNPGAIPKAGTTNVT